MSQEPGDIDRMMRLGVRVVQALCRVLTPSVAAILR
jgi:hypothetical protein